MYARSCVRATTLSLGQRHQPSGDTDEREEQECNDGQVELPRPSMPRRRTIHHSSSQESCYAPPSQSSTSRASNMGSRAAMNVSSFALE